MTDNLTAAGYITATAFSIGSTTITSTAAELNLLDDAVAISRAVISTVEYSTNNRIESGAMTIPAGSVITHVYAIVTVALTHNTSNVTTGIRIGTAANGEQMFADDIDLLLKTAGTTTPVGYTAVATNFLIAAYSANIQTVHVTVDNSGTAGISAGTVKFMIQYITLP